MRTAIAILALSTLALPAAAQAIDPDLEFLALDRAQDDRFGYSVSISGTIAIIGATLNDDANGSAYLYNIATGQQLFKLTASDDAPTIQFGVSVDVSGTTAIVGAFGSAYLFNTSTGDQLLELTPDGGVPNSFYGEAVAISGTTAIVGAGPGNPGAAYVFDTTTGQELFTLAPSDLASANEFGRHVAISGNTAIISAEGTTTALPSDGAAYLFDTTTGQQLFKLTPSDPLFFGFFGESVAISADYALIGNPENNAAYLFDTATGQQLFKLVPSDTETVSGIGTSVAVSDSTAFVRARRTSGQVVYLFDTTTGQQIAILAAPNGNTGDQGDSIAVSGTNVILGGDAANAATGSAYIKFLLQVASHPQSIVIDAGQTASFSIALQDPSGASYQWRREGIDLTDSANITGSHTPTLQIATTPLDQASYDCVVTNQFGSLTTSAAVLAITSSTCPGDTNNDGAVDLADLNIVLANFGTPCP